MRRSGILFLSLSILLLAAAQSYSSTHPKLDIIYPPGTQFESTADWIEITGRISCERCTLTIDGNAAPIEQDGTLRSIVRLLPNQSNTIMVILEDSEGNIIQRKLEVSVRNNIMMSHLIKPRPRDDEYPDFPVPLPVLNYVPETIAYDPMTIGGIHEEKQKEIQMRMNEAGFEDAVAAALIAPSGHISSAPAGDANTTIQIHLQGARAWRLGPDDYIVRNNQLMVPADNPLWSSMSARKDQETGALVLSFRTIADTYLSELVAGRNQSAIAVFNEAGRAYVPLRGVLENENYSVGWQDGHVYITGPSYRSASVE